MICNPGSFSVRDALALVNPAKVAVHNRPAKRGRTPNKFRVALKAMQASTSRVAVVKSRLPIAAALLAQILRLIVDLGSEERHHPVENPQLNAYKAKLTVTGNERGD